MTEVPFPLEDPLVQGCLSEVVEKYLSGLPGRSIDLSFHFGILSDWLEDRTHQMVPLFRALCYFFPIKDRATFPVPEGSEISFNLCPREENGSKPQGFSIKIEAVRREGKLRISSCEIQDYVRKVCSHAKA